MSGAAARTATTDARSPMLRAALHPLATAPRPLPRFAALLATIAGAACLWLAFPGFGFWPLAPLGVLLLLAALRGRRPVGGFWLGFLAGALMIGAHVRWTSEFLGPIPWLALTALMAFWWALGGAAIAWTYRRLHPGSGLVPLAVAGWWTLREGIESSLPYGGFAWGRLAQSQSASPFAELASWLGFAGLGFALVWLAAWTLELLAEAWTPRLSDTLSAHPDAGPRIRPRARRLIGASALAALAATALAVWPQFPTATTGTVRILAVQGDTPGASYFIPAERGSILADHAAATRLVAPGAPIDLILWPEGSVDVSPYLFTQPGVVLSRVAREYGAPVLANTVYFDGDPSDPSSPAYNSQFLWDAEGEVPGVRYDKRHPIPFGEYVPDREFYALLAPDLIGMIGREYSPGERSNVLAIDGHRYGVFICYDIVDDYLARDAARDGAEVLLAPTNNADFARTDESAQQLATARLRAIESGRALVQASTVGWSAAYGPDGSALAELDWYEPGAFVVEVPTRTGLTPAMAAGQGIEWFLAGLGPALAIAGRRRI